MNLVFPNPKNTLDVAWYMIQSFDALQAVNSVSITLVTPYTVTTQINAYPDLTVTDAQISVVDIRQANGSLVSAGHAILFKLAGGKPGLSYLLSVEYVTASDSSVLHASVMLNIAGL